MSNVVEAPRVKQRHRRHACELFVRYPGKGTKYQVRWWLRGYASINLGLYASEWLAGRVKAEVLKRVRAEDLTPLGMWRLTCRVLEDLRRRGYDGLPDLLPRYVRRRPDGALFAKVTKGGRTIVLDGPFGDPVDAHLAMSDLVAREFHNPPGRYVGVSMTRSQAAAALGLSPAEFRNRWASVFTARYGRVYRDEVSAALAAGGGAAESAREAVARFREALGRATLPTIGDLLRAQADKRRATERAGWRSRRAKRRRKPATKAA